MDSESARWHMPKEWGGLMRSNDPTLHLLLEPEQWQLFDWTESFGRGPQRGMDGMKFNTEKVDNVR